MCNMYVLSCILKKWLKLSKVFFSEAKNYFIQLGDYYL